MSETGRLTADDRAEITELFARYAWALDTGDVDTVVEIFTPDGIFDGVMDWYEGSPRIADLARDVKEGATAKGLQHWVSNSVFDGDSTRCVVKSMCFAPRRFDGTHVIIFVGYYVDTFRKDDGRWRFERRRWRPWEGQVTEGAQPWLDPTIDDKPAKKF